MFKSIRAEGLAVNSSKMDDNMFDDWCDQTVRILFSKFRELKRDNAALERIERRCSKMELAAITQVLKEIEVSPDDQLMEEKPSAVTLKPPKSWDSWTFPSTSSSSNTKQEHELANSWVPDSCSIFQQIMEGDKFEKAPTTHVPMMLALPDKPRCPEKHSDSTVLTSEWKMSVGTPPCHGISEEHTQDDSSFDEDEHQLMTTALNQKPMPSTKKQPKSKAKPTEKAKAKAKAKPPKATAVKTSIAKETGNQPDNKVLLKRATSAAYHKAYKNAMSAGSDVAAAKDAAKVAYRQAALDFQKI